MNKPNQRTKEANARLRAAAPELLSALRAMLQYYTPYAQASAEKTGEESLHSAVREARAAIAKAEGKV